MLPAFLLLALAAQVDGAPRDPKYEAYASCVRANDVGAEECRRLRDPYLQILRQSVGSQNADDAIGQADRVMARLDNDLLTVQLRAAQRSDVCNDCDLPVFSFGIHNLDILKIPGKPN